MNCTWEWYPRNGRADGLSAKNVVLAGVKSVTIYDPEPVTVQDLGTQVSSA